MLERVVKLVVGCVPSPQGCAVAIGMIGVVVGLMSTVMTIIAVKELGWKELLLCGSGLPLHRGGAGRQGTLDIL